MNSLAPKVARTIEIVAAGKVQTAYQLAPDSPADVSDRYLHLGDGWRFFVDTRGELCELAHLGIPGSTYDMAVPQPWYDANRGEIILRGGWAVWYYPSGSIFGEPRFADEILREASRNVAGAISAALEAENVTNG